MRAFARDLQIQPSKLSEILNGKVGLSTTTARKIANNLKLPTEESTHFVTLVDSEHGRSAALRTRAHLTLKSQYSNLNYNALDLKTFQAISDWHYNAILELTETVAFESRAAWIAGRLGISTVTAKRAIADLIEIGLLKKSRSGQLTQTKAHLEVFSPLPSQHIREHHNQLIHKAQNALANVPVEERDFSSLTIAIPSAKMPLARDKIKEFRRNLARELQKDAQSDRVYCLAIQLFPLDNVEQISDKDKNEKN